MARKPVTLEESIMGWFKNIFTPKRPSTKTATDDLFISEFLIHELKKRQAGLVDGYHYTDHVERVKQLKREGLYSEAIDLLHKLVEATESEARAARGNWGVAPWYYEQLAIIYRKEKRFDDEVSILERYELQQKAPGVGPSGLAERLINAKKLAAKQ